MKRLKTIIKVIYNLLFVFLIISAAFILLTTYDVIPGFNFYVVMSGSMEPAIPVGSVVVANEQDTYHIDDVITVRDRNNPNETFTHRVIRKIEEDEEILYETKGDANESADPQPSSEELVVGKQILSIPLIGYLVHFAKQPTGFILMIVVPSIIIATSEVTTIKEESGTLINKWKEKKEKDKEEEKEEKPNKKKTKESKKKQEPKKKEEPKKKAKKEEPKKKQKSKKKTKKQPKPKSKKQTKKKQKSKKKSSKRKNISSKKKKK